MSDVVEKIDDKVDQRLPQTEPSPCTPTPERELIDDQAVIDRPPKRSRAASDDDSPLPRRMPCPPTRVSRALQPTTAVTPSAAQVQPMEAQGTSRLQAKRLEAHLSTGAGQASSGELGISR